VTEIKIGKTYKIGRARYRVTKIEDGKVYAMCARYLLSYPVERFERMVERAAAQADERRASRGADRT
jgi:hypothetical protein